MSCGMLNIWGQRCLTSDLWGNLWGVRRLIPAGDPAGSGRSPVTPGIQKSKSDLIYLHFSSVKVTFLRGSSRRDLVTHSKTKPTQARTEWEGPAAPATWGERGIMGDYDILLSSTFPALGAFLNSQQCRSGKEMELSLNSRQPADLT